jgi:predicted Zn-dependent protease
MKLIHILLLACALVGTSLQSATAATAQGPTVWLVRELAKAPTDTLPLRDARDRVVKTIPSSQAVYLYAVFTGLLEAAELEAEFYLIEGKDPNAMATLGEKGENVIVINFAMLDLLGDDLHALAAVIGHEMAHLKLDHYQDKVDALQRNQDSMITAANTKYSRDNEREADYLGMIWSIEAGYDPEGAVRAQEALYKLARHGGMFVGSHPSSIERITVLKSLARRLKK